MARKSQVKSTDRSKSSQQIGAADIVLLQKRGEAALNYYQHIGLAEVRSRATDLVLSGLICLGGMAFFDWTALTMLSFMVVDALITVLADLFKYTLAWRWIAESHRVDHEAGTVLLIADGLEDGSGTFPERGTAPAPGTIIFSEWWLQSFSCPWWVRHCRVPVSSPSNRCSQRKPFAGSCSPI